MILPGLKLGNIIIVVKSDIDIDEEKSITFQASSGLTKIIKVPKNTTIENLLEKYFEEIGFEDNDNKDKILFLSNGESLDPNSQ